MSSGPASLRRVSVLAVLGVASALSTSCFVVTDLGRFEKAQALTPSNFSDLQVTVRGLTSHVNERFEYRVVDSSNVIQSRGVIIPLGGPASTFYVPGAVPKQNGPFHFDFYADHDSSGAYDPRPDTTLDHSWRLPLGDDLINDKGAFVIVFDHNTSFTNLNTPAPATELGKPLTVHVRGMDTFQKKRVEIRIADASTKRVVAMYRIPVLNSSSFDAVVAGMLEPGVTYSVEIYTDDGNAGDIRAYRFEQLAADTGLEATFTAANPGDTPGGTEVFDAKGPR